MATDITSKSFQCELHFWGHLDLGRHLSYSKLLLLLLELRLPGLHCHYCSFEAQTGLPQLLTRIWGNTKVQRVALAPSAVAQNERHATHHHNSVHWEGRASSLHSLTSHRDTQDNAPLPILYILPSTPSLPFFPSMWRADLWGNSSCPRNLLLQLCS